MCCAHRTPVPRALRLVLRTGLWPAALAIGERQTSGPAASWDGGVPVATALRKVEFLNPVNFEAIKPPKTTPREAESSDHHEGKSANYLICKSNLRSFGERHDSSYAIQKKAEFEAAAEKGGLFEVLVEVGYKLDEENKASVARKIGVDGDDFLHGLWLIKQIDKIKPKNQRLNLR